MHGRKSKHNADSDDRSGQSSSKKRKVYSDKADNFQQHSWDHKSSFDKRAEQKSTNEEEKDSKLHDLTVYYEKILQTLKTIPSEEKDVFSSNALLEGKGYEIQLSSYRISSHCIEILLSFCKDFDVWVQYMTAFAADKVQAVSNASCSHVTELLIKIGLHSMQDWMSKMNDTEEQSSEKDFFNFFISWLVDFSDFAVQNLESCLQDTYACHVLNIIICSLGGDLEAKTEKRSKNAATHKKEFQKKYAGGEQESSETLEQIVLETIPKFFKASLKSLAKGILGLENISDYVFEESSSTVIETLLTILKKRLPKRCKKVVLGLTSKLSEVKDSDGIPRVFKDKSGTFVIEKLFSAADEELQQRLWEEFFSPHIQSMVTHRLGNHSFQKIVDSIESKTLFELVIGSMENLYCEVLKCHHYGVFVSLATACNRLKSQQGQFMKGLMNCLHCNEPEDNQLQLVPCILSFRLFNQLGELSVCLQGSLLLQNILRFQKPIKAVTSILALKNQDLAYLACNMQGCHVLNAFFSSQTVGEKNKDKLIHCMKPILVKLSCDRNGSLTLSRLWTMLTIKQKSIVSQALSESVKEMQGDQNGSTIFKKFGLFYFKKYPEKWKSIQKELDERCKNKNQ